MEIYADNLTASLNDIDQSEFTFNSYRPQLGSILGHLPEKANLKMRAARYISYPDQAKNVQGNINHIMDHGYAHLMTKLDPSRTVITVHDIIPILAGRGLIHGVTDQRRARLAEWTSRFYKKAAHIIAISESTKRDLVDHCGCDERKISVIYFGINSLFKKHQNQEKEILREKLGLPTNKYLILVTGQQFYKNLSTSLRVMELLRERYGSDIVLVRLGRETDEWRNDISKNTFHNQIIQLGFLSQEQLPQLYNSVDCLLFPSWYEGFGLPPVEAMACGTPVVTSNVASLPEAAGDSAVTSAPDDVEGLADGVVRLLEDSDFRNSRISKGFLHAKQFNWKQNASRTMDVYREIIQE